MSNTKPTIHIQPYYSPCGEIVLASVGDELCLCDWSGMPCAERNKRRLARYINADFKAETNAILEEAKRQLDEYFAGTRRVFDIPLRTVGTDFQQQVWNALLSIPHGVFTRTGTHQATARRLFCRPPRTAAYPPPPFRHRISAPRLEGIARNSLRRNPELQGNRHKHRQTAKHKSRGWSHRSKRHQHPHSLPPRSRQQPFPYGICRRSAS